MPNFLDAIANGFFGLAQGVGDFISGGPPKKVTSNEWKQYNNAVPHKPVTNHDIDSDPTPIAQPTYNYSGSGGGAARPAYDPAVISQYDQSISLLQDSLNRLGTQKGIAQGNVNKQYGTQVNELNTAKANSNKQYDTSTLQNKQSNRTSKNAILDQQSSGLRGLLSMLGAYGAVGSDLGVAGNAVADDATMKRSGASQTYAQNQQGLDTNWNNFLSEWSNSKKKVDDWKTQQLNNVEQQSLASRQDLLTRLADYRGQRAAAMGGSYSGGAAGNLAEARGLSGRIDQLGAINPTYNGKAPVYNAPTLASYATPQQAQIAMGGAGSTSANPYLALLGLQDDKRREGF